MTTEPANDVPIGSYPVCGTCEASAVLRDAWAVWNRMTATWELQATFETFHCEACNGPAQIAWKIDKAFRTQRVRRLNDAMRRGDVLHGRVVITSGIDALGQEACVSIMRAVETFDDFSPDNDPHGEHDFGAITHAGEKVFWKIDYFDRNLTAHSPDKANPEVTERVLTVMLASEY